MIRVEGTREAIRALEALPVRVQRQVARKVIGAAAADLNKAMKAAVPTPDYATGASGRAAQAARRQNRAIQRLVKASIGRRRKTYTNTGAVVEIVGPRWNFTRDDPELPSGEAASAWAHRMERGTDGYTKHPFVRQAFESRRQALEGIIRDKLRALVQEEARRAAR
jgi:HK97 gp10 family phage protein